MPQNESMLDFLNQDQSQTLTGGYTGPPSYAKQDIPATIDSALRALLVGPHHAQTIEDLRNQIVPRSPSFTELFEYLPGASRGGVKSPPASAGLGGRQLGMINRIEDWLTRSGIQYSLNMNRSNANSVYIYARHPITGENIAIRVPRDGHIGYVDQRAQAKYKDTNRPGNFFDTGHSITNMNRPPQREYVGNIGGEPYHELDTLFDALSHRFSRSPSGQFLVSPGREPHYPSERVTPIPMTQPPIAYGLRGIVRRGPPPSAPTNTLNGPRRIVLPPRQPRQLDLFR